MPHAKTLKNITAALSLAGLAASAIGILAISPASAQGQRFDLNATKNDFYKNQDNGPSLTRGDMEADPFASSGNNKAQDDFGGAIDAPTGGWQTARQAAPPYKAPFGLGAQDQGGQFNGAPMNPQLGMAPPPQQFVPQQPQQQMMPPQQAKPPLTAEEAYEATLGWDKWHHDVAQVIFQRYNSAAELAFQSSPPLRGVVAYTVTRDGRILNVHVTERSPNVIFNTMLLGCVNSVAGDPVLQFPQGTHRQTVDKVSVFTWRYGHEGFKYIQGDNEHYKQQAPPRMMAPPGMGMPMMRR